MREVSGMIRGVLITAVAVLVFALVLVDGNAGGF